MDELKVQLSNCYGISSFEGAFDFRSNQNKAKACAIYAPNGLMKTSFAKTFEKLSKGEKPQEERFGRQTDCIVEADGVGIHEEEVYVLKAEVDIGSDTDEVTNILVDEEYKSRYDSLVKELTQIKSKLISALQKKSKVKKTEVEDKLAQDFGGDDFIHCIKLASEVAINDDLSNFFYGEVFDPKASGIIESPEFIDKAEEFNSRYQELFDKEGTIYKRGVFNPIKADSAFSVLHKNGFFDAGHKVHLSGDEESVSHEQIQGKIEAIHHSIDSDSELKKIRESLARNAQTQAYADLFEKLSSEEVEYLLIKIMKERQKEFKKELWGYYVQNCSETASLISAYEENKDEIEEIEAIAAMEAPNWAKAIELFNDRFVDMPFTLSLFNKAEASLGKEKANLKFTFKDGEDQVDCTRSQVKALSQGERRALYLLNFIFDVEDRKRLQKETLFVIDDAADSFDYKNKHAIVQYLEDLSDKSYFSQIILTHNFDFFRALANNFVHRDRCMMASRNQGGMVLSKAEGIKNYFVNVWKRKVNNDDFVLCATVPFTRNIVEYTKGEDDGDYLQLTSLLHWKSDTSQMTVGGYLSIYNRVFGTEHPDDRGKLFIELLFEKADEISDRDVHDGLNLEDKVLLSMAIRLKAEIFITDELRVIKGDADFWCQSKNQFGVLVKQYLAEQPAGDAVRSLEKVSVTVSSNIHLNSFMYEPILDLTIDHLIELYDEIKGLPSSAGCL
ncbi:hypothetical protein [Halomonas stenophila]|uniref:Protein CR006 P-loop domain-containing protein n=1 Tax=Halomonas stenophila TaxID=795312 RepID=A0A7W5HL92_9GAMM|nr:hypothetical protein [Halomonas stenophila]MBB3231311.1 hypothetical protein [Halomonas stenophila]